MTISIAVIKILSLATISFLFALFSTPALTHFLYNYKLGKKIRQKKVPLFFKLHRHKAGTPSMGGIIIWGTVLILAVLFALLPKIIPNQKIALLNFLSRRETLLPLGALIITAVLGLIDDFLSIVGFGKHKAGIKFRYKIFLYLIVGLWGALWFYCKLNWNIIHIPLNGDIFLGWLFIPFFTLVSVGSAFAVNEIDGLDGLAGGVLLTNFAAFLAIAFSIGKYDLAGLCAVIVGALIAFLWFNIPPARFFMGDTGSMSLGIILAIIAFYLKSSLLLPIIGLILVAEAFSVILQMASKKIRGKKILLSAPLHHHLEARGWPEAKIVMRFWIISMICSMLGLVLMLLDKTL